MLADRLQSTVRDTAVQLKPATERPPFHRQLSPREALAWWLKHRYDQFGQQAMAGWSPLQKAQLDAWLASAVQAIMPQATQHQAPFPIGTPEAIIGRGLSQENREYGAPGSDQLSF